MVLPRLLNEVVSSTIEALNKFVEVSRDPVYLNFLVLLVNVICIPLSVSLRKDTITNITHFYSYWSTINLTHNLNLLKCLLKFHYYPLILNNIDRQRWTMPKRYVQKTLRNVLRKVVSKEQGWFSSQAIKRYAKRTR